MRKIILFAAMLMAGCVSVPANFNPSGASVDALAYIETLSAAKTGSRMTVKVSSIYNTAGERVVGTSSWVEQDRWSEVYIQPGEYLVQLYCSTGYISAYPRIRLSVASATKYSLDCKVIMEKDFLGLNKPKGMEALVIN